MQLTDYAKAILLVGFLRARILLGRQWEIQVKRRPVEGKALAQDIRHAALRQRLAEP